MCVVEKAKAVADVNLGFLAGIEKHTTDAIQSATVPALENLTAEYHRNDEDGPWAEGQQYQPKRVISFWDPLVKEAAEDFTFVSDEVSMEAGETSNFLEGYANTAADFVELGLVSATKKATHNFTGIFMECIKKAEDDTMRVADQANVVAEVYLTFLRKYAIKVLEDDEVIEHKNRKLSEKNGAPEWCIEEFVKEASKENAILIAQFTKDMQVASEDAMLLFGKARETANVALECVNKYEECVKSWYSD